jgi:hypothetical protein
MSDDLTTRSILLIEWQEAKKQSAFWQAEEMELRKRVASLLPVVNEGVNTLPLEYGYALKVTGNRNYSLAYKNGEIDEALQHIRMLGAEGAFLADRMVRWKPELSLAEYKKLDKANPTHRRVKELIDGALTITESAPKVEIKEPAKVT